MNCVGFVPFVYTGFINKYTNKEIIPSTLIIILLWLILRHKCIISVDVLLSGVTNMHVNTEYHFITLLSINCARYWRLVFIFNLYHQSRNNWRFETTCDKIKYRRYLEFLVISCEICHHVKNVYILEFMLVKGFIFLVFSLTLPITHMFCSLFQFTNDL